MENTKKCPFCAEEINIEAIKCKHCQSDLMIKEKIDINIFFDKYQNYLSQKSKWKYLILNRDEKNKSLLLEMDKWLNPLILIILLLLWIIPWIIYLIINSWKIKVDVKFDENWKVLYSSINSDFLKDWFNNAT